VPRQVTQQAERQAGVEARVQESGGAGGEAGGEARGQARRRGAHHGVGARVVAVGVVSGALPTRTAIHSHAGGTAAAAEEVGLQAQDMKQGREKGGRHRLGVATVAVEGSTDAPGVGMCSMHWV
jgi:hypothetical protein